jgi:hypothetical protein
MNKINDDELKHLRSQFTLHDASKTGYISYVSFRIIFGELGKVFASDEEARSICNKISHGADEVTFFQITIFYKTAKNNGEITCQIPVALPPSRPLRPLDSILPIVTPVIHNTEKPLLDKFCRQCGRSRAVMTARFCSYCGKQFSDASPQVNAINHQPSNINSLSTSHNSSNVNNEQPNDGLILSQSAKPATLKEPGSDHIHPHPQKLHHHHHHHEPLKFPEKQIPANLNDIPISPLVESNLNTGPVSANNLPGIDDASSNVSSQIMSDLPKSKRHNLIQELYLTENNYYNDLQALCELRSRLQPLNHPTLELQSPNEGSSLLSIEEYDFLFDPSFEKIILCSQLLIQELEERLDGLSDYTIVCVGTLFCNMVDYVSSYSPFLNHYDERQLLMTKLRTSKPQFNALIKSIESKYKCLADVTISVVQRIPRYTMLLSAILGCTDSSHLDFIELSKAEEFVKEATTILNEGKKQYDKKRMAVLIASQLSLKPEDFRLFEYEELLFALPVTTKAEQQQCAIKFRFIIFNTCIVIAKLKANVLDGVESIPLKKISNLTFLDDSHSIVFPTNITSDVVPLKAYLKSGSAMKSLKGTYISVIANYELNSKNDTKKASQNAINTFKKKTLINLSKMMENTIEDLESKDSVPSTQRDLDAIALFEELLKAEKDRVKSLKKMKKPKNESEESLKIDLVTQKEMDAFALFEELQKAEMERKKSLRKNGKGEPTILIEEAKPIPKPEIIPTTQKEIDAFTLFEELQKAETQRKSDLLAKSENVSPTKDTKTRPSKLGQSKDRPKANTMKDYKPNMANPSSDQRSGREWFIVYFDLLREQKKSIIKSKSQLSLQAHVTSLCSLRALIEEDQVVLNNDMVLIDPLELESLMINTLDYSEIFIISNQVYNDAQLNNKKKTSKKGNGEKAKARDTSDIKKSDKLSVSQKTSSGHSSPSSRRSSQNEKSDAS